MVFADGWVEGWMDGWMDGWIAKPFGILSLMSLLVLVQQGGLVACLACLLGLLACSDGWVLKWVVGWLYRNKIV